jgi:uncharacterized protein
MTSQSLSQIYQFNTYELPRRAGEMREYSLDIEVPEAVGVPLVAVPAGDVIELDMRLESVTEGILLSADLYAVAKGECIRCLDPLEIVIDRKIQELYRYEPTAENGARRHKKRPVAVDEDIDLEAEDELWMDGNTMDLERPVRDAIVLELPVNPLCSQDCRGLCPECGEKWANLPDDHLHEVKDARWAGLADLDF